MELDSKIKTLIVVIGKIQEEVIFEKDDHVDGFLHIVSVIVVVDSVEEDSRIVVELVEEVVQLYM